MAKSLKKSSDSERYLPYDILCMVLVLLPTKILLQMRSVCKLWRDIIADCNFIKSHLDRANDVHNHSLKRYMDNAGCIRSTGFRDSWRRYELTVPMKQFSPHVEILASCNGLILLGDHVKCYYLWNPSTRLLKQFNGPSLYRDELRNFALGYDAMTKAYKVVRIVRFTGGRLRGSKKEVMYRRTKSVYDSTTASIYNIKTEKWEMIEHFPYVVCGIAQGVTVNGTPHWVMYRDHSANDRVVYPVIVCCDLVEDRFKEILKPDWLDEFCMFEYGVLEGKLCFVRYITEQKIEVWVMQDYGKSWINVSSLVDLASLRLPGWCGDRPLGYFGALDFNEAFYVESLVSPFGGGDNGDMLG